MPEYIIYDGENTFRFFWSENEQGWLYDRYVDKVLIEEMDDMESEDGGCCTGSLFDAFEMAGIENIKAEEEEEEEDKKILKCPKCGENNFYAEEITSYNASFDDDGVLDLTDAEAEGINGAIICKGCRHKIEKSEQDFELNFN